MGKFIALALATAVLFLPIQAQTTEDIQEE